MFKSCKRYGDGECFAGEDLFKRDGEGEEVEGIIERWKDCVQSGLPFLIIYFPLVVLLATPQLMIVGGLV